MPDHASSRQSGAHKASWLDRAVDILKPQPGPPPKPHAPPVHEGEWHKSVERKQIVPGLTVHDVGLSVFGETRSLHDRPGSNEPLGAARQKVAHVIINGAEEAHRRGQKPPTVHGPIEPRDLHNPQERTAYESSMNPRGRTDQHAIRPVLQFLLGKGRQIAHRLAQHLQLGVRKEEIVARQKCGRLILAQR